jgi:hypothetical protein
MPDAYEHWDFPIAGPDPLMPLFKADAAGLGDGFTEEALKRRGVKVRQAQHERPVANVAPKRSLGAIET